MLYLEAKAHQRLGDAKAALTGYEGFLAAASDADPALRRDAEQQVAALRQIASRSMPPLAPAAPPGAPITFAALDEENPYGIATEGATCVTPCRIYLLPGTHKVLVSGAGSFDFDIDVRRAPGTVRVQHPWSGMLISGVVLTTAGAVMMIGGNLGIINSFSADGPASNLGAVIAFGWVLGPVSHLVGIGLLAGGAAKLSGANTIQPVSLDVAPTQHGTTARMTFAF